MRKRDTHADRFAAQLASLVVRRLASEPALAEARVMERVGSFLKNLGTTLSAIAASGLTARGFRSTSDLEFYFDLCRGSEDLVAVAKGWNDPGSRVFDLIWIRNSAVPRFKEAVGQILEACSDEGVCFVIRQSSREGIEAELWTPLYGDTLNPKLLKRAVQALADCKRKIRRLCPFESEPPTGSSSYERN